MFDQFCMSQRLRSIFQGESLPPEVSTLATLYQQTFEDADSGGTGITDALAFKDPDNEVADMLDSPRSRLDAKTHHMVQQLVNGGGTVSPLVQYHCRIKQQDLIFSPCDDNFTNGQVVIHTAQDWSAGSIQEIFTAVWSSTEGTQFSRMFAKVLPYKVLDATIIHYDYYRQFGFAGGRLFYNKLLENDALIIALDSLTSHFAFTPQNDSSITIPIFHALPLNKVSNNDFFTSKRPLIVMTSLPNLWSEDPLTKNLQCSRTQIFAPNIL